MVDPGNLRKRLNELSAQPTVRRPTSPMPSNEVLADLLGGRPARSEHGDLYLIEMCSDDVGLAHIKRQFARLFDRPFQVADESLAQLLAGAPEEVLFLDIETTGFSNCPLFLIGLLFYAEDALRLELLFARDYSEELGVLAYFAQKLSHFRQLVSFNGRSFDVPFIRNRLVYHQFAQEIELPHFDLLHHARRAWKDVLPNCRLQTLEARICHRPRVGDISSALIPEAYHEFVRTGQTYLLKEILHHNVLDLLTMAELLAILVEVSPST